MAVKLSALTIEATPAGTDILAIADPSTGVMKKISAADLEAFLETLRPEAPTGGGGLEGNLFS